MKINTNIDGKDIVITLSKEQLKDIQKQLDNKITIDDISTNDYQTNFNIAYKLLKENNCLVISDEYNTNSYIYKLLTIIKAANFIDNDYKEWIADFNNNEYKFIPYWKKKSSGWSLCTVSSVSYFCSTCSVGLYYKSENTAKLLVERLDILYQKYLG